MDDASRGSYGALDRGRQRSLNCRLLQDHAWIAMPMPMRKRRRIGPQDPECFLSIAPVHWLDRPHFNFIEPAMCIAVNQL
jgi:hypothetical protein